MTTIKSDMVRARVEPELKERAEAVLEKLGMSTADAIRIFLTQVALRQAFPLELTLPTTERLPAGDDLRLGRDSRHSLLIVHISQSVVELILSQSATSGQVDTRHGE